MRQTIKLKESQLKQIITETVKKVLREDNQDGVDYSKLDNDEISDLLQFEYENNEGNIMEVINDIIKAKRSNLSHGDIDFLLEYTPKEHKIGVINAMIKAKGSDLNYIDISRILPRVIIKYIPNVINSIIKTKGVNLSDGDIRELLRHTHKENKSHVESLLKKYRPDYFNN